MANVALQKLSKADNPPTATLYISNLPDKLHIADVRVNLYMLFGEYGRVHDIQTSKRWKMRGQAHVVYDNIGDATAAMADLQGFEFIGKKMKISYSNKESLTIPRMLGIAPDIGPEKKLSNRAKASLPDDTKSSQLLSDRAPQGKLSAPPNSLPPPPGMLPPPPGTTSTAVPETEQATSTVTGKKHPREETDGDNDDDSTEPKLKKQDKYKKVEINKEEENEDDDSEAEMELASDDD